MLELNGTHSSYAWLTKEPLDGWHMATLHTYMLILNAKFITWISTPLNQHVVGMPMYTRSGGKSRVEEALRTSTPGNAVLQFQVEKRFGTRDYNAEGLHYVCHETVLRWSHT